MSIKKNSTEIFDLLMEKKAKLNFKHKNTFLLQSVCCFDHNCSYFIEKLLKNGFDVNNTDDDGMSPIQYAAMVNNIENVICLINNGADVNTKNEGITF